MRCPKCGESFQVTAPGESSPPVLGAALGLSSEATKTAPPPKHKATMLGVAEQAAGGEKKPEPPRAAPPRPGGAPPTQRKNTMLGVAPAGPEGGLELAALDDDSEPDAGDVTDGEEFDLAASRSKVALDLPAPTSQTDRTSQIDLPSVAPEVGLPLASRDEAELPDLASSAEELGLPELGRQETGLPARADSIGLPTPVEADLPDLGADLPDLGADLPELDAELPTVGGNLPEPSGQLPGLSGELPVQISSASSGDDDGFGEIDPFGDNPESSEAPESLDFGDIEPVGDVEEIDLSGSSPLDDVSSASDLGSADDIFGHGPKPTPESLPPGGADSAFGEVSLEGGETVEEEDEFDAFPTASPKDTAGGGDGYGDVVLEGGGGDFDLGTDVDHAVATDEGHPPRGPTPAASASVTAPAHVEKFGGKKSKGAKKKKRRKTTGLSKATRIGLGALLLAAVAGGALAMVPDVGPYGAFYVIDMMNAEENLAFLRKDTKLANERLVKDTASELALAFKDLDRGRQRSPRFKPRIAYAAYIGYLHQLRFRAASGVSAQAQVLLKSLAEVDPKSVEYLDLARLAKQAATGNAAEAVARSSQLIARGGEFAVVAGEAALVAKDPEVALSAWSAVLKAEKSPRSLFGMARALKLSGKAEEARKQVDATLKANPQHAGARLLLAEIQLRSRELDDALVQNLTPLSAGKDGASPGEQVHALVLLGQLHLARSRIKKAEVSFTNALKLDSGSGLAQRGLARALFEGGRYSEALARFEAAVQAEPKDLSASLGIVQCKLKLEQLEDAMKLLVSLVEKHPKSSAAAYWVGRGKERAGEKEDAEKAYENAIELGENTPELVLSYVSLTRLLSQRGSLEEAGEVISDAEKKFPDDPAVYEALGELSSNRGSYEDAIEDFDKALTLDPNNIGLRFSRGVALRQARRFQEAAAEFDRVEKESPEYPGLALERGNLFEASGRSEEALKAYELALAAAPDDLDLKLRVACGKASAGQSKSPIELLKPVLEKRPNSAEVNFCQGLALLNGDGKMPVARRHLQRAVNRDPTRAKHHLYMGWVALQMGDLQLAAVSLDKAIGIDRTLADAYWKRGELRVKQRAVKDALVDLDKALELAPSRLEAYAQKAMAYLELGKEQDAMAAYKKAVESELVAPAWHYRYGDLLLANRRPGEARKQLELAVRKAEEEKRAPVWLSNAHRLLATAIGRHPDALKHWKSYMDAKKGTQDPYLRDALREMRIILDAQGM